MNCHGGKTVVNIEIRNESVADIPAISALTVAAFIRAPHTSYTEQFIINALRAAGKLTISLVALLEETIVGHVGYRRLPFRMARWNGTVLARFQCYPNISDAEWALGWCARR